ncbi:glycosyltransferase involved in cell wall biosynthesis [Pantoea dispersa]|uniref:glycosyltransferase family 4 protein n=1 Tax=Pantoea dispersa TaxID=59814 RepID=UPI003D1BABFD
MKKNTKVVIVARSLPIHGIGGMEVVCWDLCLELARRGLNVIVITTQNNSKKEKYNHDNLEVVFLENTKPGRYSRKWWREASEYFSSLNAEDISAVISISAAGVSLLKHRDNYKNAKFIMQAHGTSFAEFISKLKSFSAKNWFTSGRNIIWFFKDWVYYKKFDCIVSIGTAVTESLRSNPTKVITQNVEVVEIENGVDQEMFKFSMEERTKIRKSLGVSDDALLLLSVSRLHEQKGVDNNIQSFAKICEKNRNAYYLICGDGKEKSNLIELCRKLKIENNVFFLGSMDRLAISGVMSAADVFLFLTKRVEGLPLNVLEAMAAGLPVITSKHLSFIENKKIRKIDSSDFDSAAEFAKELSFLGKPENRESHIPLKNTLAYSVEQYCHLISD